MYRAIYLAKALDMEVYGVVTNANNYKGHEKREIREMLARVKDYFKAIIYKSINPTQKLGIDTPKKVVLLII